MNPLQSPARVVSSFNAAIISGSDIFTIGIRSLLRNEVRANAICIFAVPEQLSMIGFAGVGNIDLVIIDDDVLSKKNVSLRWINSLEGLEHSRIVVLTGAYGVERIKNRLRGGAWACVDKRMSLETLTQAICSVLDGKYWIEEDFRQYFGASTRAAKIGELREIKVGESAELLAMLTPAEQRVISWLLAGMTVSEIAQHTSRSVKTVSGQKQSAMRKLHVDSLIALSRIVERPCLL